MAPSTVPAAEAALLVLLRGRVPLAAPVLVDWGPPDELPQVADRIYVGNSIGIERKWAALGALRMDEEFTVRVHVLAYLAGCTLAEIKQRHWALIHEVELTVRENPKLSGAVRVAQIDGFEPDPAYLPTNDGWVGGTVMNIFCESRI